MRRNLFLLVVTFGLFTSVHAQQRAMYTQYMFNMIDVNPAYAGTRDMLNVLVLERKQWLGMEGTPSSQTFSINSPIITEMIGIGLSLNNDALGPVRETGVFGDFSYRFKISQNTVMSLGLKAGGIWYNNNLSKLFIIDKNDPSFAYDIENKFAPNFGTGIYIYGKKFYAGISIPRLLKTEIGLNTKSTSRIGKEERHYFAIGGYVFDINSNLKFKPTVLLKYVINSPLSIDASANFLYNDRLWLAATYRFGDALGAIAQYRIVKQFWLGYSYDFSLNKTMSFNSGTHEITLSYDFMFGKYKVKSPRYF